MSYLVMPFGIILFLINAPFAFATFGIAAFRFDPSTATIETTGGIASTVTLIFSPLTRGFNLGNFTFLISVPGAGLSVQTPFTTPGLSAHETGHTLTVAAFGGIFGWINAVDENIPPFRRLALAYGEMVPESHLPRPLFVFVRVWS